MAGTYDIAQFSQSFAKTFGVSTYSPDGAPSPPESEYSSPSVGSSFDVIHVDAASAVHRRVALVNTTSGPDVAKKTSDAEKHVLREFRTPEEQDRGMKIYTFLASQDFDKRRILHVADASRRRTVVKKSKTTTMLRVVPYLVTEEYDFTLQSAFDAGTQMSYPALKSWVRDVVEQVAELHRIGVLHNAVSPASVAICGTTEQTRDPAYPYGTAKLCSFERATLTDVNKIRALARFTVQEQRASPTESALYQRPELDEYSARFAAPEIVKGKEDPTVKSEAFSVGRVLQLCLVGHASGSLEDVYASPPIARDGLDSIGTTEYYDCIRRLCNKEPRKRSTAAEVLHHPFFWTTDEKAIFLKTWYNFLSVATTVPEVDQWGRKQEHWYPDKVKDFVAELCLEASPDIKYEFDKTYKGQLDFFDNLYDHLVKARTPTICGGSPDAFVLDFVNKRFPGIVTSAMKVVYGSGVVRTRFVHYLRNNVNHAGLRQHFGLRPIDDGMSGSTSPRKSR